MLDAKKIHETEQAQMAVRELWPPIWHGLYVGCIEKGFTKLEAFELVKTFIMANGTGSNKA